MKKQYSLDFSIVRDIDRVRAVEDILDKLEKNPSQTELEQMASYILYGKDENGQNSLQRNEIIDKNSKRYKSYKTKDDKVQSLEEMLERPSFDEQKLKSAYKRDSYVIPKPRIFRPKYDKQGNMIDPGDSNIPGMREQWEIIDRWQHALDVAQGRVPPREGDTIITESYRIYQLKHNLIDIRRHQYYLKDSYSPEIHFQNLDTPKPQFYDWSGDSFYWVTREQWEDKVQHSYTHLVSKRLTDYEVRADGMIKWVVCKHTFDWENPYHVRALLNHYHTLYEALHDKLNTYGRTLIWDFDRYVEMCHFSNLRMFLINMRKLGLSYEDILEEMRHQYGFEYSANYLASIVGTEIPSRIARVARLWRLEIETPNSEKKMCNKCGKLYPPDTLFFSRNSSHRDGLSSTCKKCDRESRIKRGVINNVDHRTKDPTLPQMQAGQTN